MTGDIEDVVLIKALPERTKLKKNDLFLVDDSVNDTYTVTWEKLIQTLNSYHRKTQIGMIIMGFSTEPPLGTLYCDGKLINKRDYSELYDVIGDKFKQNEDTDSSKFRLPDMKKMFIRGADTTNQLGTKQEDGIKYIGFNTSGTHFDGSFNCSVGDGGVSLIEGASGIFSSTSDYYSRLPVLSVSTTKQRGTKISVSIDLDASLYNSNNIADEVRPKNMSINYFIYY